MSVTTKHPEYLKRVESWELMRDSYEGEEAIKDKTFKYLPATPGQVIDGLQPEQKGWKNYRAYLKRARFHDFVYQAIEKLVGIMHHKPPTIKLPLQLEALRKRATVKGEPLDILLRRINLEQLIPGRLGLLADVRDGAPANELPYVALYRAEDVINWDDGARDELVLQNLNLVVLDESEDERVGDFEWRTQNKYRVLVLGEVEANEAGREGTVYRTAVVRDDATRLPEGSLRAPSIGSRTLDRIPFVFVNAKDIVPDPDVPPLLGLARLGLTVYRGEADYRQTLFMQGQDTLVIVGGMGGEGEETRVGAGATIELQVGGSAEYIGVSSEGLEEQRMSLQNDRAEASEMGGALLDARGKEAESGDALRIRVSARTASLVQIARAGAEGLKEILKIMAEWVGANPEEVDVEPNRDFADDTLEGRTVVDFMAAKTMGAPISLESIHRLLKEKDITQLEFEEEMRLIENEAPAPTGTEEGGDEDDDE